MSKLPRRWLITATDTNVGKTVVTSVLAQALRTHGSVIAAKPVASGLSIDQQHPQDAVDIATAAGHNPTYFAVFRAPLSPHRASALEQRTIVPSQLEHWANQLSADNVLLEGVGGYRVPLTPTYFVSDFAKACAHAMVIVAPNRIGVINQVLLTVEAIQRDGLPIVGIVLNNRFSTTDDPSSHYNLQDIKALLSIPVATLDHVDLQSESQRMVAGQQVLSQLLQREHSSHNLT